APKKLLYQMPRSARITGIFFLKCAFLKCWSISYAPSNNSSKFSNPTDKQILSPIALQSEYLPPTQSQNWNIFSASIPKFSTSVLFVESATKCLATSFSFADESKNQVLAECALVIVSCVVKVLGAMMNECVSGFRVCNVAAMCDPTTIETKCKLSHVLCCCKASLTLTGHKTESPMPIFSTSVIY